MESPESLIGVKKYRSVPTVIEAIQAIDDEDQLAEIAQWADGKFEVTPEEDQEDDAIAGVFDVTHNTWISVYPGQWIIKGTKGEFYPCADDVFNQKYELAEQ